MLTTLVRVWGSNDMGGGGATVEQNLKMAKWWGRNNINKVSEFLENWNCTPSLAPGVNKKILRPISKKVSMVYFENYKPS